MSTIPKRLERLPMTSVQWSIYWLCAAGVLFGSTDIFTIFSIGIPVQTTFNLSSVELGIIIGSAAPAAVAGAFVAGVLGDYLGRKAIFQYTLLLYAVGSIITGLAPNFYVFLLGRSILGFGIGGELPTIMALISEYVPRKIRGTLLALLNGMYAFGFVLATNLALAIVPRYSWRPLFFILAVPAIIVLILRRYGLPESARWLEARGRKEEAEKIISGIETKIEKKGIKLPQVDLSETLPVQTVKAPLREIFSGSTRKITILLIWMWFITTFAGLGLPSFFIPIMTSHFNYTYIEALSTLAYASYIQIIGIFLSIYLIEAVGRKPMLVATYFLFGLTIILLGITLGDKSAVFFTVTAVELLLAMNFSMVLAYTPEIYPTRNRSSGNAISTTSYNFTLFIAPILIGYLITILAGRSVENLFYVVGALLLITVIPVIIWAFETKGRVLEEIAT